MKKNEKILKIIFLGTLTLVVILFVIYFLVSQQSKKLGSKPNPTPSPVYVANLSGQGYRTFKNYDASYTQIAYTGTENYQDENGNWLPISTKITASKKQEYSYEVTTNSIKTYFKDTLNEIDYMLLADGDKKIYQGIEEMQENLGAINHNKAEVKDNIITYPEIVSGVDLRYRVSKDKIEEEFVVKNRDAADKIKSFLEFITLENIKYNKDSEGNISLDKSINFYKPVIFESDNQKNAPNNAIEYIDVQTSLNKFSLKKALTEDGIKWLKQEGRKFPVIIDPTVTYTGSAGGDDGASKQGSSSNGANVAGTSHIVGNMKTTMSAAAGFPTGAYTVGFRFKPNIPRSSTITSAYLYLYHRHSNQGVGGGQLTTNIIGQKLVSSLSPTPADCAIYTTSDAPGGGARRSDNATTAVVAYNPYVENDTWFTKPTGTPPNISSVVSEVVSGANWIAGTSYLCLVLDNNTSNDYRAMADAYGVAPTPSSNACGNNSAAPCLTVNYTISAATSPAATTNNASKVVVSWTGVTDVSQYKIYYSASSGACGTKTLLTTVNGATSYDDTGASAPTVNAPSSITASTTDKDKIIVTVGTAGTTSNGATRYYQVTAVSGGYESACSTEVSGYRAAGSVSGYDIFYNGDAYASALATNQSSPYNDSAAAAPTLTAPSNLSASTTTGGGSTCNTIVLTIGTAGVSTNGTSRTYKLKTRDSLSNLSALSAASNAGYRSYGSVTGYNIYQDGDSYASAIATNQSSPYSDTAAPTAVLVQPKITPSAGTYTNKISFNVTAAAVTPGARTYKAKTYAGSGNLSAISAASATAGNTTGSVTNYYFQVADTSSSTTYGDIANSATIPYDWTGCSLDIHGWYRTYYKITGNCTSSYSHTTGGIEGYCSNPTAPKNFLMQGVQFTGVKIAP
jgi:hypothetical protein